MILVPDGPGFLVNRCGRPFGGEALRLLQERVATVEQVDRIVRLGGGFRMGPFELMDLVGIDVGYEVAQSFNAQSFGEPRWKPSLLQAQMVAAGLLGRKTGRGCTRTRTGRTGPTILSRARPAAGTAAGGDLRLGSSGPGIARAGASRGLRPARAGDAARADRRRTRRGVAGRQRPRRAAAARGLRQQQPRGSVGSRRLRLPSPAARRRPRSSSSRGSPRRATLRPRPPELLHALGFEPSGLRTPPGWCWAGSSAGLVNEALFAVGEGVGSADDVDTGLTLGLNHPRGP